MWARSCWRWGERLPALTRHSRESGNPASFLMRGGWVYILANRYRGTIYTGVTADLSARTYQHRTQARGFVARYGVALLVYVEEYPTIDEAIAREKAIKKWRRDWKIELIEKQNQDWLDRYDELIGV
jgi:putative endonuclease